MKHQKKAEGRIDRNAGNIIIKMKTIVRILQVIKIDRAGGGVSME